MTKTKILTTEKAPRVAAVLVRFESRDQVNIIKAGAARCGLGMNFFVSRIAELAARKILADGVEHALLKFAVSAADSLEKESAA